MKIRLLNFKDKIVLSFYVFLVSFSMVKFAGAQQSTVDRGLRKIQSGNFDDSISRSRDVNELIGTVISYALGVVGAIAVVFLIYGGFLYVTSAGNEEQAEKGRAAIVNSLIGIALIILSYVIVRVIVNLVTDRG